MYFLYLEGVKSLARVSITNQTNRHTFTDNIIGMVRERVYLTTRLLRLYFNVELLLMKA